MAARRFGVLAFWRFGVLVILNKKGSGGSLKYCVFCVLAKMLEGVEKLLSVLSGGVT